MKKIILILIVIFATSALFAQVREKSDYEKYWEAREAAKYNVDTLQLTAEEAKNIEYDDVYYQPSQDKKQVTTIFDRKPKEPKPEGYYQGYGDGYKEGVEDVARLFDDDYYYANRIYRFNYGFSYSYYSPNWRFHYGFYDPFWYDPFYYDWYSPYYSWGYPYYGYNYWYSPYYYSWNYPYYNYSWNYYSYNYRQSNYGHGALGSRYYGYDSRNYNTKNSYIPVGNYKSIPSQKYVTYGTKGSSTLGTSKAISSQPQKRQVTTAFTPAQ